MKNKNKLYRGEHQVQYDLIMISINITEIKSDSELMMKWRIPEETYVEI